MTRFIPELEAQEPVGSVLEQALVRVQHPPRWVVVEQPSRGWVQDLIGVPPGDRAGSVVVAGTELAMAAAARLGFGGAVWLPPSTVAMRAALAAAAGAPNVVADLDLGVLEQVAATPEKAVVTWPGVAFWRRQIGLRRLSHLLLELARELAVVPALTCDPALVMAAGDGNRVLTAWERAAGGRSVPPTPTVIRLDPGVRGLSAVRAALGALEHGPDACGLEPQPVCALPSGEVICSWVPQHADRAGLASPADDGGHGWRVALADGGELTVPEVEDCAGLEASSADVVRVPGWIGAEALPSSPAGLLLERMASAAKRAGRTLWVPSVQTGALGFLLRLGGRLWVDGQAVPSR
jgi:hypothetical protein